jgi:hypothetical protein
VAKEEERAEYSSLWYSQNNPYLGLQISDDLKWTTHITNVTMKANATLRFLRRNLKYCPKDCPLRL